MTDTPVIEAQLLRWSESHNGRTVTLQLPPDGEHPFRGLPCGPANGARLAIAIARINDDETTTPVETDSEKPKGGRLAQQAGIVCGEGAFRKFLGDEYPDALVDAEGDVAAAVRIICDVDSRKEFDTDTLKGAAWRGLNDEYQVWLKGL